VTTLLTLVIIAAGMALVLVALSRGRAHREAEERLRGLVSGREIEAAPGPAVLRLPATLTLVLFRADFEPRRLAIALGAMLLLSAVLGAVALGPWRAALLALLFVGGTALLVWRRMATRLATLEKDLPAFLDRMRQHIEIGASVDQAIRRAALASGPRLREAMEPLHRRIANGEPVPEALDWLAKREGGVALPVFAAAVSASLRYGGRLAGTIANIARTLRQRARMEQELRASTAETRASALVLTALPLLVAGGVTAINPGHLDYFTDPDRGTRAGMLALGLYLTGVVLVRRLARPRF
jgi:tight adherence protein B